jgi:hypothetical protein
MSDNEDLSDVLDSDNHQHFQDNYYHDNDERDDSEDDDDVKSLEGDYDDDLYASRLCSLLRTFLFYLKDPISILNRMCPNGTAWILRRRWRRTPSSDASVWS